MNATLKEAKSLGMNPEGLMNPPEDIKTLTKSVFVAMAYEETVREVVIPYQQAILDREQYSYSDKMKIRRDYTDSDAVTKLNDTWLMDDEDFKHYDKRCQEEALKAGFSPKPGCCPLLEAENLTRIAEKFFVDALEPYTNISGQSLLCSGLDNYKKYIKLNLNYLVRFIDSKF